jgi:DNA-binding transcriptional regulator YiaG
MTQLTVKQWLNHLCVNRSKLARRLGVVRQTVAAWEQKDRIPERHRAQIKGIWKDKAPDYLFESAQA